jgi:hypothetical protein
VIPARLSNDEIDAALAADADDNDTATDCYEISARIALAAQVLVVPQILMN